MSQFGETFEDTMGAGQTEERTSGLAVASFVTSLICCIPGLGLIGALLGAIALMVRKPGVKGKGFAVAGLILGLIFTVAWGALVYGGYQLYNNMPAMALRDPNAMAGMFGSTTAEASAFITEVEGRYGSIQSSQITGFTQVGQAGRIEYDLVFPSQTLEGQLVLPTQMGAQNLDSLVIVDPTLGDLVFPPGGGSSVAPAPAGGADGTDGADGADGSGEDGADGAAGG